MVWMECFAKLVNSGLSGPSGIVNPYPEKSSAALKPVLACTSKPRDFSSVILRAIANSLVYFIPCALSVPLRPGREPQVIQHQRHAVRRT